MAYNEQVYYVYKITNTINGKAYIGITNCCSMRWHQHQLEAMKASNKKVFYQEMASYGIGNFTFEVIEGDMTSWKAVRRERYWIDELQTASPYGYNIDRGSLKRLKIKQAKTEPWKYEKQIQQQDNL